LPAVNRILKLLSGDLCKSLDSIGTRSIVPPEMQ
jgi:hypothetical protein